MGFPSTIVHRDRLNVPFTLQDFTGAYYTPTGETVFWDTLSAYLLSAGSPSGADVRTMQAALGLPTTGQWDADTAAGIVNIQMTFGLPTTGLPDRATLAKVAAVIGGAGGGGKKKKSDSTSEIVTLAVVALAVKLLFFRGE